MKALITGVNGVVGGHLAEYLPATDWQLAGVALRGALKLASLVARVEIQAVDLLDAAAIQAVLDRTRPDVIFHLAAQSHVPTALAAPAETITNNIVAQLNVLEGIRSL